MGADPVRASRCLDALLRRALEHGVPRSPIAASSLAVPGATAPQSRLMHESFLFENYIGGRWCQPASGRYLQQAPDRGPGGRVARADARDIADACAAAREAAPDWARCGRAVRRAELGQLPGRVAVQAGVWDGDSTEQVTDDMARREGHASPQGPASVAASVAALRDLVRALPFRSRSTPIGDPADGADAPMTLVTLAEAPPLEVCRDLLRVLYDGRTLVALLLYRDARRLPVLLLQLLGILAAGLPAGVVNILTGLGLEAGVALVRERGAGGAPRLHRLHSIDALSLGTAILPSTQGYRGEA